ncbi:MAG: penicillin-binding transpeptidase domain-containing protein [Acutalibacteraceae bacterium]
MSKIPTLSMRKRMFICVIAIVIAGFGTIGGRLAYLMLIRGGYFKSVANSQQTSSTKIEAKRGNIYDCNMNILATSASVWTVYITPKDITSSQTAGIIADGLSDILGLDRDTVYAKTQKNTAYEKIKTKVEEPEAKKVREFISEKSLGTMIGLDEGTKRYYPNGNLASTVLGFVGSDNQGLAGIESYYNETLTGVPGTVVSLKNARGGDMPYSYETTTEAQDGYSLVTTIDSRIQYYAEKYLEQAVEENGCTNRGCCIVMDVNTGEIYAMATKPDYDPNDPFTIYDESVAEEINQITDETAKTAAISNAQQAQWRNKAINDVYEPGSVFKIITGSAALEENVITPEYEYTCTGSITISGTKYKCAKTSGHGSQKLIQMFGNSCNPAFISIGQRLGVTKFCEYFRSYGLSEKTGIDLPGEAESIYYSESSMGTVELASESFGQTFKVTAIQLITAVCAAANGGYLVQPHIVKQVVDNDGNVVKNIETMVKRQVISESTSEYIREACEYVVSNGGGKNAYVSGYSIAGKTGTAEKVDLRGEDGSKQYVSSFCGFAPADDPKIAVIVVLDEPHGKSYYGGTIAAPVVGSIFSDVLPYLGVEPEYSTEELSQIRVKVDNVTGKSVTAAQSAILAQGLSYNIIGSGSEVVSQIPEAGSTVTVGGTVLLYTDGETETQTTTVPDFTGMTVSQANLAASKAGLNIVFKGSSLTASGAKAYEQDIAGGSTVPKESVVTVKFKSDDITE